MGSRRVIVRQVALLLCACIFSFGASALAQGSAGAGSSFECPSRGYFPPVYGVIGRNGGDGPAATEAVSPCVLKEVVAAAEALGMARSFAGSPLGVKSIVTEEITFTGEFAADGSRLVPVDRIDFHVHYGFPAARLMVQRTGAQPDIRVFRDAVAWNEASEGGAATPVRNAAQVRERLILTKLTPAGALWSVIEAEAHAKVTQARGRTVVTGASPYDGLVVSITLDEKNLPASVTVKDGKVTYGAAFSDYGVTPDKLKVDWEPDNGVVFPKSITWTKNGKALGRFRTTRYFSNPYVVFPVPMAAR